MSKPIHQLSLKEFERRFPDDDACKVYLTKCRWPGGVCCPRCGAVDPYTVAQRPFHWQCHQCNPQGYRFSVLVGTVFENTNVPLRQWFQVLHMMLTSKKGISALQIFRLLGFGSYKTAWGMCHKLRAGMQAPDFHKLMGIVEVDETFVGGKAKNRHKDKRGGPGGTGNAGGTGGSGKAIIVGAVRRKGNVVARVIENVSTAALSRFVSEAVSRKVSLLCTDQYRGYNELDFATRTGSSITRKASTSSAQFTPTPSKAFGLCSSAGLWVRITRYLPSICHCTLPSSSSATTTERILRFLILR